MVIYISGIGFDSNKLSKFISAAVLFLLSSVSSAGEWSRSDMALEAGYIAVTVADLSTTLDIKNHAGFYEKNPVLGMHPTDKTILVSMALTIAAQLSIAEMLPKEFRTRWIASTLGIEIFCVADNLNQGLKMQYSSNF